MDFTEADHSVTKVEEDDYWSSFQIIVLGGKISQIRGKLKVNINYHSECKTKKHKSWSYSQGTHFVRIYLLTFRFVSIPELEENAFCCWW